MNYLNRCFVLFGVLLLAASFSVPTSRSEEVGGRWGTEEREREYYPIVNIPIPQDLVIEAGFLHPA